MDKRHFVSEFMEVDHVLCSIDAHIYYHVRDSGCRFGIELSSRPHLPDVSAGGLRQHCGV